MRLRHIAGILLGCWLLAAPSARAATLAAGDLQLTLDPACRVTGISVAGRPLPLAPAPLVTLYDAGRAKWFVPTAGKGDLNGGLALDFGQAKAAAVLTIQSRQGAMRFRCRVEGAALPARGMLLRFAFPLDAAGWTWHNDLQSAVPIRADRVYENVVPLRAWADLPEWKDQPDLRMGYSNRNFCTVLSGPAGLCLAVPLDRPCIFRTAYRGRERRLQLVYDFALSPDTRKPNQAEFAFDLYACDPKWGFRAALEKYYRLYPDMFRNYVKEPGQWMAFNRLAEIDNANEFYFGLQEGASDPAYDDQLGVLSTTYFTHAGMGADIPGYDPEKDPLPPHEVQVAAMEAAFKRRTGVEGMYRQVGLVNAEGKLDVRKWVAYAHLIAQFNLDPELPYGRWTLDRALATIDQVGRTRKARLDGFYYDGLSAGVNYRPDHFRTADAPCLWDPVAQKPLINNFFSSCEFARAAAELMRPRGRITMMNGALGASFYVAPWLDVLGSETGLRISRERLNYIRSVTHHKPLLTLLKGDYHQQLGRPPIERYMKQCLAYGVFPGFFDWPTSGLGPGGRYWDHPSYFERDRDLHRKYQPLCRALAAAGWEPVTRARCASPRVFVERFGPAADGVAWFTVFNEGKQAEQATLTIEAGALGLDPQAVRTVEMIEEAPIPLAVTGGELAARIDVPPGDVRLVQVAPPPAAARWRLAQAIETLDRGRLMREMDAEKPSIAVHWRPGGPVYSRESAGGKQRIILTGDGRSVTRATQWVMLFQQKPGEVVLRVRAGARDLAAAKGAAGVECRLAWVTPSFSHYETRFFDLPPGTYEDKDFEFPIASPHALRAIHVVPQLRRRAKGTLRVTRLSVADASGTEYAVDPTFAEWYEPFPAELRGPIEQSCRELRGELAKLDQSLRRAAAPPGRPAVDEILGRIAKIRQAIHAQHAANGCRRVLRDIETVERHVRFLMSAQ